MFDGINQLFDNINYFYYEYWIKVLHSVTEHGITLENRYMAYLVNYNWDTFDITTLPLFTADTLQSEKCAYISILNEYFNQLGLLECFFKHSVTLLLIPNHYLSQCWIIDFGKLGMCFSEIRLEIRHSSTRYWLCLKMPSLNWGSFCIYPVAAASLYISTYFLSMA